MRLLHEIAIFQTVKSKVIISLFETVRLSVSISLRNLYNSLNSIKENFFTNIQTLRRNTFRLILWCTVDSRYLDFGYLEQPLISKRKSGPCLNLRSGNKYCR